MCFLTFHKSNYRLSSFSALRSVLSSTGLEVSPDTGNIVRL